jgi:hypothetical protein
MFTHAQARTSAIAAIVCLTVRRRHLTKGQPAVAVLLARAAVKITDSLAATAREPGLQAGPLYHAVVDMNDGPAAQPPSTDLMAPAMGTVAEQAAEHGVSLDWFSKARMVQRWAPELAALVMAGDLPLAEAYEKARIGKQAREGSDARLAELRQEAPDLAELVDEEKLTLGEACGAVAERRRARPGCAAPCGFWTTCRRRTSASTWPRPSSRRRRRTTKPDRI